ncbi:hypothetical protein E2562_038978 [Oryza meyeriana var. granulata]|uniref:Uncharacterized protein n=1 Tax=Oryza meyeriana var. granulata TaxID=110450 RepID=A0A6G1FH58_9ORYZ|nr:hypothetical protein E2562_038978 [Oryza meyeriana var. granulata]
MAAGSDQARRSGRAWARCDLEHIESCDGKVILVFHLGGRTADATKFVIRDGTPHLLSLRRDPFLGGDDFTARVVDYMANLIRGKHGGRDDVRADAAALRRLTAECERAKKALSYRDETVVRVRFDDDDGGVVSLLLTRAKLEELTGDLVSRAVGLVESCDGGSDDGVDEILLVGGSTRIPMVRDPRQGLLPWQGSQQGGEPRA